MFGVDGVFTAVPPLKDRSDRNSTSGVRSAQSSSTGPASSSSSSASATGTAATASSGTATSAATTASTASGGASAGAGPSGTGSGGTATGDGGGSGVDTPPVAAPSSGPASTDTVAHSPFSPRLEASDHKPIHIVRSLPILQGLAAAHTTSTQAAAAIETTKGQIAALFETRTSRRRAEEQCRVARERVAALRRQRDERKMAVEAARVSVSATVDVLRARLEAGRKVSSALRAKTADARKAERRLDVARGNYGLAEELLMSRRLSLVSDLRTVYPIFELDAGQMYSIRGAKLPTQEARHLQSLEEEEVSTALGYTCHLVALLSKYLEVPLRYFPQHMGSRSQIRDDVIHPGSEYPLYSKGVDAKAFKVGVVMLQRDVKQLCNAQGLDIPDKHHMLQSLMQLFSHVLGGLPPL